MSEGAWNHVCKQTDLANDHGVQDVDGDGPELVVVREAERKDVLDEPGHELHLVASMSTLECRGLGCSLFGPPDRVPKANEDLRAFASDVAR